MIQLEQIARPYRQHVAEPFHRNVALPWDGVAAKLKLAYWVLQPLRFGIAMMLAVAVAVIGPNQAIDALRVLTEDRAPWPMVMLFVAVIYFSGSSWAWARGLLFTLRPMQREEIDRLQWKVGRAAQNFLGLAPFVILSVALVRAMLATGDRPAAITAGILAGTAFLLAVAFYEKLYRKQRYVENAAATGPNTGRNAITALPVATQLLAWSAVVLWLVAFFVARERGALGATLFGPVTVVLFASVLWLSLGSFMVWLGAKVRLPLLMIAALLMVVFSGFDLNDNHGLRRVPQRVSADTTAFARTFSAWLAGRADRERFARANQPYPVFVVAAEGGGLRAAYYSAQVLATIQDACPAFARHVFAISGISGGSLGSTVFAGIARARAANDTTDSCGVAPSGSFRQAADSVLGRDFLSPVLASLFFPDLANRFLFWPIESADRARPLELGWERAWHAVLRDSGMSRPFHGLWSGGFAAGATPALLLNTTNVETGRQHVASNLTRFGARSRGITTLRPGTLDDVPLSAAVGLSARFPAVTPAAAIGEGSAKRRYVDGGYFENSGVATALDVLSLIPARDAATGMRVRPIVIQIVSVDSAAIRETVALTSRAFGEVMSPIRTLLNTRQARGETAMWQLHAMTETPACGRSGGQAQYIRFVLRDAGQTVPLGWMLSRQSRATMRAQLDSLVQAAAAPGTCNALNQVRSMLAG